MSAQQTASNLVFLHGYESSPQSFKANLIRDYATAHFPGLRVEIPSLDQNAFIATQTIDQLLSQLEGKTAIIGSSMGGFYATHFAEKYDCLAVLVNPVVDAHILFEPRLPQSMHDSGEAKHLLEFLQSISVSSIKSAERFLLLLQTADETLDYKQALARYEACSVLKWLGGDHRFDGFESVLPLIARFLNLK